MPANTTLAVPGFFKQLFEKTREDSRSVFPPIKASPPNIVCSADVICSPCGFPSASA